MTEHHGPHGTAIAERDDAPAAPEHPAAHGDATPGGRGTGERRRRPRWPWWLVGALALAVAGAVTAWLLLGPGLTGPRGQVAATGSGGSQALTVTRGTMSIDQLHDALVAAGQPDALQRTAGGAWLLGEDLVVGPGADVTVSDAALLLRSDPERHVRLSVADGGHLTLDRSTVAAWAGAGAVDGELGDGRADIVAEGEGSSLDVTGSRLSHLGSAAEGAGLVWRSGAGGSLVDTTVDSSWVGALADRSGAVEVRGSRVTGSGRDGIVLREPGAGTTVEDTTLAGNRGDGLVLRDARDLVVSSVTAHDNRGDGVEAEGTRDLEVDDARLYQNAGAGLALRSGSGSAVTGARAWANESGVFVGAGSARINDAHVSANTGDGVLVRGEGTSVSVTSSRLDHNQRAGLWVAGSTARVTGSTFDRNTTGLRGGEAPTTLVASDNTVVDSVQDGVALHDGSGDGVSGNTISGSGLAAVSVATGDPAPVVEANTVGGSQEASRVRDDG